MAIVYRVPCTGTKYSVSSVCSSLFSYRVVRVLCTEEYCLRNNAASSVELSRPARPVSREPGCVRVHATVAKAARLFFVTAAGPHSTCCQPRLHEILACHVSSRYRYEQRLNITSLVAVQLCRAVYGVRVRSIRVAAPSIPCAEGGISKQIKERVPEPWVKVK